MSTLSPDTPAYIAEPFGSTLLLARVVAVLQAVLLLTLALPLEMGISGLCMGLLFVGGTWAGAEAFGRWHHRRRVETFLTGKECDAVVVAKRFAWRGGFWSLQVAFEANGQAVQAWAALDTLHARSQVGDRIRIRYLPRSPDWWVPLDGPRCQLAT